MYRGSIVVGHDAAESGQNLLQFWGARREIDQKNIILVFLFSSSLFQFVVLLILILH